MNGLNRSRVPRIVFLYWVIKIAATTLGETGADMFSMTFDLGYGVTISLFVALFVVLLTIKVRVERYTPVLYWSTFTASAIAGTAICDFIDRTLGVGYALGSLLLVSVLIVVLALWRRTEGALSVEKITTAREELFYWLAFLIANTLGTAAGDFVADDLGLGFMRSAGMFSAVLLAIVLFYRFSKLSPVLLFWLAFVFTRPFGATFGDFLTKPSSLGGIDLGTVGASLFFFAVMVVALVWEALHPREVVD